MARGRSSIPILRTVAGSDGFGGAFRETRQVGCRAPPGLRPPVLHSCANLPLGDMGKSIGWRWSERATTRTDSAGPYSIRDSGRMLLSWPTYREVNSRPVFGKPRSCKRPPLTLSPSASRAWRRLAAGRPWWCPTGSAFPSSIRGSASNGPCSGSRGGAPRSCGILTACRREPARGSQANRERYACHQVGEVWLRLHSDLPEGHPRARRRATNA